MAMLQLDHPEDFVIATGRQKVLEFIELAKSLGWSKNSKSIIWEGSGLNEIGRRAVQAVVIKVDERYFRPAEVDTLLGNAAKAKEKLGWEENNFRRIS